MITKEMSFGVRLYKDLDESFPLIEVWPRENYIAFLGSRSQCSKGEIIPPVKAVVWIRREGVHRTSVDPVLN